MKRALTVLPLIALLLGLVVFVLRRSVPPSEGPQGRPGIPAPATPPAAPAATEARPPAPIPASASPKTATGSIRFVVTLRGQPAPDARITVQKGGTEEFMKFKTEADGTQYLHGLASAEYGVYIEQEDAPPYSTDVLLAPGENAVVRAELKVGGRVTGTVTDRGGRPIPNTRVFLLDQVTKLPPDGNSATTDDKGRYALKGIPPGNYGVRYRNVLYKPLDRMGLVFRGADDYPIDVVLEVGARISGRVVDETDAPIEGADVVAGNGDSAGISKSAADGSFTVTGLTDAPANISAAKAGYGKVVIRNLSGNPTNVLFRLLKAGTVIGRLIIDKVPEQTQITLSTYDEELKQVIPADSRFFALPTTATFAFADVTPGTYWIDVLAEGYEAVDRPQIVVAPGRTTSETRITMRKKN